MNRESLDVHVYVVDIAYRDAIDLLLTRLGYRFTLHTRLGELFQVLDALDVVAEPGAVVIVGPWLDVIDYAELPELVHRTCGAIRWLILWDPTGSGAEIPIREFGRESTIQVTQLPLRARALLSFLQSAQLG